VKSKDIRWSAKPYIQHQHAKQMKCNGVKDVCVAGVYVYIRDFLCVLRI